MRVCPKNGSLSGGMNSSLSGGMSSLSSLSGGMNESLSDFPRVCPVVKVRWYEW